MATTWLYKNIYYLKYTLKKHIIQDKKITDIHNLHKVVRVANVL